ncbi:MAG: farnesyl-diphosphate farnesyltransferase [Candidatus Rokubacteria bacterium RIFCSPLOWO2_12_FULL_69_21]|nr:MAG: farnesyl-diphosphate farnesyltransferase [Candidatus Rokubacteria bacterium RIFCSPLOWO2_12_FULL_69_21]
MARDDLTGDLLKRVSRSFYLSLAILPRSVRGPVGLAYLFARAADTIADTRLISREERLRHLEAFRDELWEEMPSRLAKIITACTGPNPHAGERELLSRLPECFARFRKLDKPDRNRVWRLLFTITEGMIWDLNTFPGEDEKRLVALEKREELDRYTYHVAGCVGEFWTEIHVAHRPRLAVWNLEEMKAKGVRFGKGLQMTNVLRDLARDLRHGRCYLPLTDLARLGLEPADLLDPGAIRRVRPLVTELLALTLEHYDAGWEYTLAIPRAEWRMRLACAWPLLIGLRTLGLLADSPNLLDPREKIKIPRSLVYSILLRSLLLTGSNRLLAAEAKRLRARIPV